MQKPIFYFEKLNTWDKVTIILYTILSLFLWFYFNNSEINTQQKILYTYTGWTQFLLYFFNYKSLRNLSVYFIWILFALIHLFIYYELNNIESLKMVNSHAASGFKNTLILLLVFQILRFISAKTQHKELICPGIGNSSDIFDDRKGTIIDWISLIVFTYLILYL